MSPFKHNPSSFHRLSCSQSTPARLPEPSMGSDLPPAEKSAEPAEGICCLWLTWKLIRNQKLRTAAIFCGLLFSCFLLESFGSFGYDFWTQVHGGGTGEAAAYDQTQLILISLVAVLLILVAACSGILLHNLYSLTFAQRWRSLTRLLALGARPRDIAAMAVLENILLFCTCVPLGCLLTLAAADIVGIRSGAPLWLWGGILLWIWAVSCLCSIRPLWAALRRPSLEPKKRRKRFTRQSSERLHPLHPVHPVSLRSMSSDSTGFRGFMTRKYRLSNRSHHIRIIITVLAAILLYVPAGYLIETNLSVQRAGLDAEYGIQYDCAPQNRPELDASIGECRRLAEEGPSLIYVSMSASASVKTDLLSRELLGVLKSAGWPGDIFFPADCTLYFLEDQAYEKYLESCRGTEDMAGGQAVFPAVLIDRYINRSRWSEDAVPSYQEVPLLDAQKDCSGINIYYETVGDIWQDLHWNREKSLLPDAVTSKIPEGLDFGGSLSVILPLSRLENFLSPQTGFPDLNVCGKFQDPDETSFSRLEAVLGEDAQGCLRYTRKILQEWYSSMSGIHKAMTAICSLLFFMAALNIFSMLLFQYMERRKGLAVLWSLGQSPGELLRILAWEHIRNLLAAVILGIPLSGLLCYYIFRIFRQVWHMDFVFPVRQTALIMAAVCFLSLAAILTEKLLMGRQDFLKDIRDIT